MRYNIIGDVHTRTNWKELVKDDCINVFVGDYFAPYGYEFDVHPSFERQCEVFFDVIRYKEAHPETVLLIGNHDTEHWKLIGRDKSNRYDAYNARKICALFDDDQDKFQMALSMDGKAIVTHAGVSALWYENYIHDGDYDLTDICRYKGESADDAFGKFLEQNKWARDSEYLAEGRDLYVWKDGIYKYDNGGIVRQSYNPDEVAANINKYWEDGHYDAFMFQSRRFDGCGDDPYNSPVWVRPTSLRSANIMKGTGCWQFMGHTQMKQPGVLCGDELVGMERYEEEKLTPDVNDKLVFVDCLGYYTGSVIYDSDTSEVTLNAIKKDDIKK